MRSCNFLIIIYFKNSNDWEAVFWWFSFLWTDRCSVKNRQHVTVYFNRLKGKKGKLNLGWRHQRLSHKLGSHDWTRTLTWTLAAHLNTSGWFMEDLIDWQVDRLSGEEMENPFRSHRGRPSNNHYLLCVPEAVQQNPFWTSLTSSHQTRDRNSQELHLHLYYMQHWWQEINRQEH